MQFGGLAFPGVEVVSNDFPFEAIVFVFSAPNGVKWGILCWKIPQKPEKSYAEGQKRKPHAAGDVRLMGMRFCGAILTIFPRIVLE